VIVKKIDDLQKIISEIKASDFGIPIDSGNFRN